MKKYIDAEKLCDLARNHVDCSVTPNDIMRFPAADVREIGKDQWHILSDDPYDETGAPTEDGKYLVIDEYGNEYVDYFFSEPRLTKNGVSYWLNSVYVIKAWIRLGE